jgi:hypothetical protein
VGDDYQSDVPPTIQNGDSETQVAPFHASFSSQEKGFVAEKSSDWEVIDDEASGKPYYLNSKTGETTWECPAGETFL